MITINTSATLSSGIAQQIAPQRTGRTLLTLQNTGVGGPVTFGFGSAPVAGQGISLDPASVAGGQGGSYTFPDAHIPNDSVWAISSAGTTIVVLEGVG